MPQPHSPDRGRLPSSLHVLPRPPPDIAPTPPPPYFFTRSSDKPQPGAPHDTHEHGIANGRPFRRLPRCCGCRLSPSAAPAVRLGHRPLHEATSIAARAPPHIPHPTSTDMRQWRPPPVALAAHRAVGHALPSAAAIVVDCLPSTGSDRTQLAQLHTTMARAPSVRGAVWVRIRRSLFPLTPNSMTLHPRWV